MPCLSAVLARYLHIFFKYIKKYVHIICLSSRKLVRDLVRKLDPKLVRKLVA
ncbi:hypothetical protein GCM10011282_05460 [Undibacterium macrobrachii]|uniref:Transposase n=1 Tax=Undibacterium macrobrachii TaxID=1119058 RepID=A0ABQ2X6S0_9BURK|nr:hypothetical protein GCM10011282_05460 [Undibacterium macrobrachii]